MVDRITSEFLEKVLDKPISSFKISTGSNPGDGYLSNLYSVDVTLIEKDENGESRCLHLLFKCYPSHPSRQELLNQNNCWTKELEVYRTWVPELKGFYKKFGFDAESQLLPFVPFFGGSSIVFDKDAHIVAGKATIFHPLDNYIVMPDIRKTFGYKLSNRLRPYDFDHYKLVTEAQATLHATSWAYKQKYGLRVLSDKFPQLRHHFYSDVGLKFIYDIFDNGHKLCLAVLTDKLGDQSPLFKATENFGGIAHKVIATHFLGYLEEDSLTKKNNFLRRPTLTKPGDEPWTVLTHGDPWPNNMLFRYDPKTGKPVQVLPVDFQLCHESCPTSDLVFFCCYSTDFEFRQKYVNSMLQLYHDKFLEICQMFQVNPLPGFTLQELRRRFHISKAFAMAVSMWGLPIIMNRAEDQANLDSGGKEQDVAAAIASQQKSLMKNEEFSTRLIESVREFYEDGII